jgi:hypothetical protein
MRFEKLRRAQHVSTMGENQLNQCRQWLKKDSQFSEKIETLTRPQLFLRQINDL